MDTQIEILEKIKSVYLQHRQRMENFDHGNRLGWIYYKNYELEELHKKIKDIETQIIIRNFVLNNE